MQFKNRQIKAIALSVAMLFVLGIAAVAATQTGVIHAAASSSVGVINYQRVFMSHPDVAKAEETLKTAAGLAKSDYDTKAVSMNDQQKQEYAQKLQQELDQKQQGLLGPINDKVNAEIKNVADAKGLTVVVDKSAAVYGGQDITDEVINKLKN